MTTEFAVTSHISLLQKQKLHCQIFMNTPKAIPLNSIAFSMLFVTWGRAVMADYRFGREITFFLSWSLAFSWLIVVKWLWNEIMGIRQIRLSSARPNVCGKFGWLLLRIVCREAIFYIFLCQTESQQVRLKYQIIMGTV